MDLTIAGAPMLTLLLASVRIIAWMVLVPPFSSRAIPITAKVMLSLALAVAGVSMMGPEGITSVPTTTPDLLGLVLAQIVIGALMGFVTSMLFAAVAAAGALIDVFGGFSLAQGFDPLGMTMNSVIGKLHQMLAVVLLFVSGGHLLVLGGLLRTFEMLPIGSTPDIDTASEVLMRAFHVFFVTAVQIALPLIAVLFLADLGLALMTKVAPQLNAINVVFPAKIGLTLLLVGLSFPALPGVMDRLVDLTMQATATLAGGA
ncbi:flagellar biosynthetic protein FliR [Nocardioides sp.]|uniref:flagellar biosynthetic protein FliR n=1 Tax=Nocardioides sp. TaxID=35761 RepID=UPI00351821E1